MDDQPAQHWDEQAARPEIDSAFRSLYHDIARAIEARKPRCERSGRCCHFERYGHRLYITGLETAWFLNQLEKRSDSPSLAGREPGGGSSVLPEVDSPPHPLTPSPQGEGEAHTPRDRDGGACPFLVDGLCSVHEIRPMGCRIFFCDPSAGEWQNDLYERSHQRIAALHDEHAVAYRYGEWRQMLRLFGGNSADSPRESFPPPSSSRFVDVRITC